MKITADVNVHGAQDVLDDVEYATVVLRNKRKRVAERIVLHLDEGGTSGDPVDALLVEALRRLDAMLDAYNEAL